MTAGQLNQLRWAPRSELLDAISLARANRLLVDPTRARGTIADQPGCLEHLEVL
ncbi:hypothetical protein I546_5556 [Mycobacterium kansasii 732]|nr:hypothetical protein I546_5556 [Mycobacterium kansasii 732]